MDRANHFISDDDAEWGKPWAGSAMHHNAIHQFAAGSTNSTQRPSAPSVSESKETQASHSRHDDQRVFDPPSLKFCTIYDPESGSEGHSRKDGYCVFPGISVSAENDRKTVIMALHLSMGKQSHTADPLFSASQTSTINTLYITPRLLFPIKHDTPSLDDWADQRRRDEAAESIDRSLGKLYSIGSLTGAMAGGCPKTNILMASADGTHLRKVLGTLMRKAEFNPAGSTFQWTGRQDKVSDLAAVRLKDGSIYTVAIQLTSNDMGPPSSWKDGEVYPNGGETAIKPLGEPGRHLTLNSAQTTVLRNNIKRHLQDEKHPSRIDRCVLGNVELWGPNTTRPHATSTFAGPSTAAS